MNYWLLISSTILLVVATPTLSTFGTIDFLLRFIQPLIKLKIGTFKFLHDFYQFAYNEISDFTPGQLQEFDFIVVGAGSAGAVIASRLSEDTQSRVLLIEAGGHENLLMDIPLLCLFLQKYEAILWPYVMEPSENYCRIMENKRCQVKHGKVLGGTSVLNFMLAVRGTKYDYDEWASLTGDNNWSYKAMLKMFKKLETFDGPLVEADSTYRNFDGPLRITHSPFQSTLVHGFIEAGQELGFLPVDYNGENVTGFSYAQTTQINGERMSSNRAYLHPAKKRRNLVVSINSLVTKVIIDSKTKTALGVEFIKNERKIKVLAKKEVILSTGAIATPKLLMLSGIGPSKHLISHGISVIQDLPVGENLMDHVAYGALTFIMNSTESIILRNFLKPDDPSLNDYFHRREGLFSLPGSVEGFGFFNVDDTRQENDRPNMEFLFAISTVLSDPILHKLINIDSYYYKQMFDDHVYQNAWTIWPILLKPKSRGKILLKSKNPKELPRIFPNYFSDPDDVRVLIKGIRMAIEVSKTHAMQKFGSTFYDKPIPGCENYIIDSDAYWECAVKSVTITLWHQSGTCKMGREDDSTAVVNTRLQVKGIKHLRVADASIMPNIVTAHINVPVIAIGEKASDIIKSDWGINGVPQKNKPSLHVSC